MAVNHAIIPVAGYGTRRMPIAKAVEKCMLPVLNRPIIDYSVQDCINAGIKHIILVVSESGEQFRRYYGHNEALERYLIDQNKAGQYMDIIQPPADVKFDFVVQPAGVPYGTAAPVALARSLIPKGEQAVVVMGDDMLYGGKAVNPIAELLATAGKSSAILTTEVPLSEVSSYGVLAIDADGNLERMVELPAVEEAPSTMINISKYVFTSNLLDEITNFYKEPPQPGVEKYINVPPFDRYMQKGGIIKVVRTSGTYLDTGTVEKWLHANNFVARDQGIEIR